MISDFDTNTIYFSKKLKTDFRFKKTSNRIFEILDSFKLSYSFLPDTNDIWARDYMPIQVNDTKFIEIRYDPDYLQGNSEKKDTREIKTYPDIVCDSIGLRTIKTDIILDGGNVVKSDNTIILTDKVVWENQRHYSEKQLIKKLHELFEVDRVVIIPWDEECDYGHADGMLRFINPETVMISGFYETTDEEFKKQILKTLEEAGLNWDWLRCSEKEVEKNIAYINFLQTKDLIIVPSLNKPEDDVAIEQISKHFPNYAAKKRIDKVDMREIVRYDGALNCITWTTKE
jgi:agmatine deiminase